MSVRVNMGRAMADGAEMLTLQEFALRMRLSERTVHRYIEHRLIPAIPLGRIWRIPSDVPDKIMRGEIVIPRDYLSRARKVRGDDS